MNHATIGSRVVDAHASALGEMHPDDRPYSPSVGMLRREFAHRRDALRERAVSLAVGQYRRMRNRHPERDGTTIVTVNWNSLDKVQVLLAAVRRYTSIPIDVIVVDNGSTDGSVGYLQSRSDVRLIRLRTNVGHGFGLDVGTLAADTKFVITLDVDAFPTSAGWLNAVLDPLRNGGRVAGAHFHRNFIHPCFLALRREDFIRHRLSFAPVGRFSTETLTSGAYYDVAETISHVFAIRYGSESLHRLPITASHGPGVIGSVFADVVYHNFHSTRSGDRLTRDAAAEAWREAVERWVPDAPDD